MPIAVKSITDARITINSRADENPRDGNHNVVLGFNADGKRYHVWIKPYASRTGDQWQLGDTLYSNVIDQPKFGRTPTKHLSVTTHERAIDYALRMAGGGEGTSINSSALNRLIQDHMTKVKAERVAVVEAANEARAKAIPDGLNAFVRDQAGMINSQTLTALTIVANNSADRELNALDSLFVSL